MKLFLSVQLKPALRFLKPLWHLSTTHLGSVHRKILLFTDFDAAPPKVVESPATFRLGGVQDLSHLDPVLHSYGSVDMVFARERLQAGDRLIVGEIAGQIVFYAWLSFGQIPRFMHLDPAWAYSYRVFTVEEWRGRRILPAYYLYVRPFLRGLGYSRLLCWVAASNRTSLKSHKDAGFHYLGNIWEISLFRRQFHVLSSGTRRKLNVCLPNLRWQRDVSSVSENRLRR